MRVDIFDIEWSIDDEDAPVEIYGYDFNLNEWEYHYTTHQIGILIAESLQQYGDEYNIPVSFTWVNLHNGKMSKYSMNYQARQTRSDISNHSIFDEPQIHISTLTV